VQTRGGRGEDLPEDVGAPLEEAPVDTAEELRWSKSSLTRGSVDKMVNALVYTMVGFSLTDRVSKTDEKREVKKNPNPRPDSHKKNL
jgi:hypothetical protein